MHLLSSLAASLLVLFGAAFHAAQRSSRAPPQSASDLVLLNGKIFTADSARPWVEALAIHGERIVAVGSTAAIGAQRGRSTRTIDLRGRVVIPGINDAHDHVSGAGYGVIFNTNADPISLPDPSLAQVVDSLRTLVRRTPPGTGPAFARVTRSSSSSHPPRRRRSASISARATRSAPPSAMCATSPRESSASRSTATASASRRST